MAVLAWTGIALGIVGMIFCGIAFSRRSRCTSFDAFDCRPVRGRGDDVRAMCGIIAGKFLMATA